MLPWLWQNAWNSVAQAVAGLAAAVSSGIDVRSYAFYGLVDAFEWSDGFKPKFGLYEVARPSLRRTPRASAGMYAELAAAVAPPPEQA